MSSRSGVQSPWVVPIDGGTPTQIVNEFVGFTNFDVSPDGTSIVSGSTNSQDQPIRVICDLPACTSRRELPAPTPGGGNVRWTPDGRGIAYIGAGTNNIWIQRLDGSPPHQLTRFTDGLRIGDFAWSRDGRRLAVSRVSISNDIVLFRGLRR